MSLKTKVNGFFRLGLKTNGFRFPSFGLKTGSYSLVISDSKSPRRFIGLAFKIKQATVCRLHNKIDGKVKIAWSMH
jgi:hypothetical protein